MYSHRTSTGPVDLAFTDRYDGVSAVPFDSLNLALVGEDDPEARRRNVALLLEDFAPGAGLADMEQVHGSTVVQAGGPREKCDALVTDRPDVVLMVRVADCVPRPARRRRGGVIGAAHAGRNGRCRGRRRGAASSRCAALGADRVTAWIGPHICGRCYEVPAEMRDEVAAVEPATASTTSWGTPAARPRRRSDAPSSSASASRCTDVSRCTLESPDLYSHRRDGARAGRFAGVIRRRA